MKRALGLWLSCAALVACGGTNGEPEVATRPDEHGPPQPLPPSIDARVAVGGDAYLDGTLAMSGLPWAFVGCVTSAAACATTDRHELSEEERTQLVIRLQPFSTTGDCGEPFQRSEVPGSGYLLVTPTVHAFGRGDPTSCPAASALAEWLSERATTWGWAR